VNIAVVSNYNRWWVKILPDLIFHNVVLVPQGLLDTGVSVSGHCSLPAIVHWLCPECYMPVLVCRRSRPSGEIERESVGSPSMTPRNVTPLTPLTPLKWKSNAREQEEEQKAFERSRLGSGAMSSKPISELSEGEIVLKNGSDGHIAELEQEERINDTSVHDRTKSIDEISLKAHFAAEDSAVVESPLSSDR
jgi:hypothetical protein